MAKTVKTTPRVHQSRTDCLSCEPGWPFLCECGGLVHGQKHPTFDSIHEVCDQCELADSWSSSHNSAREQKHRTRRGKECMCPDMPTRDTKPHVGEEHR